MRRAVAIAALACGCGFRPAVSTDAPAGGEPDVRLDTGVMPPGSEPVDVAPCYSTITSGLVLCLELDDPGLAQARDGSGRHHDATVMNTSAVTRDVPSTSQAIQVISSTSIDTMDSTDFDLQTFTLTAWVHREGTPGSYYGLVHNFGQYYMAIDNNDNVFCVIEDPTATTLSGPTINQNEWDLAWCSYDGASLCGGVYANGNPTSGQQDCTNVTTTLSTSSTHGIAIGSIATTTGHTDHLAGKLDSARIFNRALTQQEVCTSGGISGC